jgi:hypothetical protein
MEIKMKKFNAFAAAGLLAATALVAGQAAAENGNSAFAQATGQADYTQAPMVQHPGGSMDAPSTYGYGYEAGVMTHFAKPDGVKVYRLGELSKAERAEFRNATPGHARAIQADIRADHSLRNALVAQNVQISSVVGEIHAADGSTAYVVR